MEFRNIHTQVLQDNKLRFQDLLPEECRVYMIREKWKQT